MLMLMALLYTPLPLNRQKDARRISRFFVVMATEPDLSRDLANILVSAERNCVSVSVRDVPRARRTASLSSSIVREENGRRQHFLSSACRCGRAAGGRQAATIWCSMRVTRSAHALDALPGDVVARERVREGRSFQQAHWVIIGVSSPPIAPSPTRARLAHRSHQPPHVCRVRRMTQIGVPAAWSQPFLDECCRIFYF